MIRARWFGALAGSLLAAWAALAQEAPQGPASRPRTVRAVSAAAPWAVVGRPVAGSTGARPEAPGLLPMEIRAAPVGGGPILHPSGPKPVPEPGEIIATGGNRPHASTAFGFATTRHAGEQPAEFASDRHGGRSPVRLVGMPPATLPAPPGPRPVPGMRDIEGLTNWAGTYPVKNPPGPFMPDDRLPVMDMPSTRWYFGAEYLLWWTRADQAPPLASTGSPTLVNVPGALDSRVINDGRLDHGTRSGLRLTAGYFLGDCSGKAIELSGFFLPQNSSRFSADQSQFPVLTRPFFDTVRGIESVQIVAAPGLADGRLTIDAPSQLWGLEANMICKACCGGDCGREWRINWLAGVRYLDLREGLTITEDITPVNPADPLFFGSRITVTDRFATSNQFYGGQVGAEGRWMFGRLTLDGRVKLALGVTRQELTVDGSQQVIGRDNPDPRPGGLLALPSNIGSFSSSRFTLVPEVGGSVGYYVTDWVRLSVGYNFLYWSSVVRPGDQIDRNLNSDQVPNFNLVNVNGVFRPRRVSTDPPPQRLFNPTDYWAHGLTFGVEVNF